MKILAAGGGTAGHLFPALAVLEEFQKHTDVEILYITVSGRIDEMVIHRDHPSYRTLPIKTRGLYRPLYHPKNIIRGFQYLREIRRIRRVARTFDPDFVFLTGGYSSGIVAMALKNMFPLFLHEQNAIPGLANLYAARFAKKIFLSFEEAKVHFPESFSSKIEIVGNPIRKVFFKKGCLDIPDGVVLVMGGSLGSIEINLLMERVYEIDRKNFYVHSTGSDEWTRRLSRFPNVLARSFFECVPVLWRKAKFSITRAGATTVYEMIHYGVRGILIPWRGSTDAHQIENAKIVERAGLGMVLSNPSPKKIVEMVNQAIYNPVFSNENASNIIYKEITEAIM